MVYDLYEQYHSITKVQNHLKKMGHNVWRFRRYRDILQNRLYCGYVSFSGTYYKGRHEPIISEEQFNRVQVLLENHKGSNANRSKESLLSSLITCGECGESYLTYSTSKGNHKYRYYICRAKRFPSEFDEKCHNKTWNSEKLENHVIESLEAYLRYKQLNNKKTTDIVDYDKLIKKVDVKVERILGLYMEGTIEKDILDNQMKKLNNEKQDIINQINQQEQLNSTLTFNKIKELSVDLYAADFAKRHSVIQKLIHNIVINGTEIQIEWAF